MTVSLPTSMAAHIDRLIAPGVVDMHFDLLLDLYDRRSQRDLLRRDFLPDLRAGGMGVLGVAIYLEEQHLPEMALRVALDQVSRLYAEVESAAADFAIVKSHADIVAARAAGKIGLIITMEGVEPLGTDLDLLRIFYALGLRSVGLTHARRNLAGDGGLFAASGSSPAGLSPLGKRVVRECQRLGILVDLAHLNPAGVDDVLAMSEGPVIISHTNPRRYFDIERNSSDAHLRAVGQRGGVIGINAVLLSADEKMATLDHYVDHVEYVAELAGMDSVAIGYDFIEFLLRSWTPEQRAALEAYTTKANQAPDLQYHSHTVNLVRKLIERGFSDADIAKILYGNWMRIFAQVLG